MTDDLQSPPPSPAPGPAAPPQPPGAAAATATAAGEGPATRVGDGAPDAALRVSRPLALTVAGAALVALLASGALWLRLGAMQEQLARQSAESVAAALEARALAKSAQELAREAATRQAVMESRLSEVALQRTQLEELMQSLSRSRDENLMVDIEAAIRLALQQSQLTGSVEPLLAALRSAEVRVGRAAQPRLNPVQRAIGRDIERIRAATVTDVPALLLRLDELSRLADELPLANQVGGLAVQPAAEPVARSARPAASAPAAPGASGAPAALVWWERWVAPVREEARRLMRVSRIDNPDAALVSPEQGFFLRENLKLKLLNARLAVLARQFDAARADLAASQQAISRYFDANARRTQNAQAVLAGVQQQLKTVAVPRVDETLAALATAAAGR